MAGEPLITVVGNLAADPELRFTASGNAVANFTIAQTPRTFDRTQNQWLDDETLWVRCAAWGEAAENVAESLTKGQRVIAYGRLKARTFETRDGQQRTNWELDVDEIGPSLKWATVQVNRRQPGGQGGWANQPAQTPQSTQGAAPAQQEQPAQTPAQGQPAQTGASPWNPTPTWGDTTETPF